MNNKARLSAPAIASFGVLVLLLGLSMPRTVSASTLGSANLSVLTDVPGSGSYVGGIIGDANNDGQDEIFLTGNKLVMIEAYAGIWNTGTSMGGTVTTNAKAPIIERVENDGWQWVCYSDHRSGNAGEWLRCNRYIGTTVVEQKIVSSRFGWPGDFGPSAHDLDRDGDLELWVTSIHDQCCTAPDAHLMLFDWDHLSEAQVAPQTISDGGNMQDTQIRPITGIFGTNTDPELLWYFSEVNLEKSTYENGSFSRSSFINTASFDMTPEDPLDNDFRRGQISNYDIGEIDGLEGDDVVLTVISHNAPRVSMIVILDTYGNEIARHRIFEDVASEGGYWRTVRFADTDGDGLDEVYAASSAGQVYQADLTGYSEIDHNASVSYWDSAVADWNEDGCESVALFGILNGNTFRVAEIAAPGAHTHCGGHGTYVESGQTFASERSNSVDLGDLDGDGDLDAFIGNVEGPNRVLLNEGNGAFHDTGQSLGNRHTYHVVLGDLDRDGDLDALTTNFLGSDRTNQIWINDGAGGFSPGDTLGTRDTLGAALADLDGDGDLDAVLANYYDQPNEIWVNDGAADFTLSGTTLGQGHTWDVALGDVNNDGLIDAFFANEYPAAPNTVWLNQPNLNFFDSGQALGSGASVDVVLGDLDGDGDLDAVVANINAEANTVWTNINGVFSNSGQALGASHTHEVALGDLEGDGDLDIFAANGGGGTNTNFVWINTGLGRFQTTIQGLGSSSSQQVALGDLDGDHDLDAFVANDSVPNKVWFNESLEMPPACTATIFSDEFSDGNLSADPAWDPEYPAYSIINEALHSDGLNLDSSDRYSNGFHHMLDEHIISDDYLVLSYRGLLKGQGNPQAGRGTNMRLISRAPSPSESYNLDIQRGYTNGFPTDKTSISLSIGTNQTLIDVVLWDIAPDYDTPYDVRAVRHKGIWSLYVNGVLMGTAPDALGLTDFDEVALNPVGSVVIDTIQIEVGCPSGSGHSVDAGGPYTGAEGDAVVLSGVSVGGAAAALLNWSVDSPLCLFSDATLLNPTLICDDNGPYTTTLAVVGSAISTSVPSQSLLLFDDFSDSNLDSSLWQFATNGNASYSLQDGVLKLNSGTVNGGGGWIESTQLWTSRLYDGTADRLVLEVRWVTTSEYGGGAGFVAPGNSGHAVWNIDLNLGGLTAKFRPYDPDANTIYPHLEADHDIYHIYRVEAEATETRFYYDGVLIGTHPAGIPEDNPMRVRFDRVSRGANEVLNIDWVKLNAFKLLVSQSEDSTQITIENVAPTAQFSTPITIAEGSAFELSLDNVFDPSAADTTAGFEYAFDCGDGAGFSTSGPNSSITCLIGLSGTVTVGGKVRDKDLDETPYQAQVQNLNVAPAVTLVGPSHANEGEDKSYSYTVSDPGEEVFSLVGETCGANGSLANSVFNSATGAGSFDCTFPDGPASSSVSVTVSDGADPGSDEKTVAVANLPPTITSLSVPLTPVDLADQASFSVDVAYTDPANLLDAPFLCDFDLDNDGSTDASVSSNTLDCSTPLSVPVIKVHRIAD